MSAYVTLINWTEQGAKSVQETVKRSDNAAKALEAMGGKKIAIWWTMGPYDAVLVAEAPDDETYTKFLAGLAKLGNVRTTTMRCFSEDEARRIFGG